jgi:AcrR family transcriptional regulator
LVTYHFGGRDQLLAAAAAELFGGREADWRRALHAPSIEETIRQTSMLLAAEAQDGFWRAWISLSAENSKLTGQTVNNHWSNYANLVASSLSEILAEQGLQATVTREELGCLLAAGFQGLGLQLSSGGNPESTDETHAALWAAVLSLTRPAGRR